MSCVKKRSLSRPDHTPAQRDYSIYQKEVCDSGNTEVCHYIFLSLGQNVLDMHKPIKEKIRRVTLGRDNNQEQSKTDVNNNDYAVSKL